MQNVKIDYAMKDKNPLDLCHFYEDFRDEKSFKISIEKVGMMLPQVFMVRRIRLYTRSSEQSVVSPHGHPSSELHKTGGKMTCNS